GDTGEGIRAYGAPPVRRAKPGADMPVQRIGAVQYVGPLVSPCAGYGLQHLDKAVPAKPGAWRKICTSPEGPGVRREKHGQRPAALIAHGCECSHIDLIYVRPFFTIHLDIDEQTVHDR